MARKKQEKQPAAQEELQPPTPEIEAPPQEPAEIAPDQEPEAVTDEERLEALLTRIENLESRLMVLECFIKVFMERGNVLPVLTDLFGEG